ncbi:MAG: DivIVA domain-containing protein [Solirubrobacteraceae bacterium]
MALERQSIEKKDFPIGRRGYDPEAVDAHLTAIAEEVEELKRSARRRSETLASAASDQVRAIVEAAESSAAEIQRQAEEDAREIRAEATSEAQATREQASGQAREYVGNVSESTAVMLQRLDAMDSELTALIESLRTGSNRLNADLQLLEGNLSEVTEAVAPRPRFEREPMAPPPPSELPSPAPAAEAEFPPVADDEPPPEPDADLFDEQGEDELDFGEDVRAEPGIYEQRGTLEETAAHAEPSGDVAEPAGASPVEAGEGHDDTEGARLIALNMALNGTPREETDRYLAENFELSNRAQLLEEVYASVEG